MFILVDTYVDVSILSRFTFRLVEVEAHAMQFPPRSRLHVGIAHSRQQLSVHGNISQRDVMRQSEIEAAAFFVFVRRRCPQPRIGSFIIRLHSPTPTGIDHRVDTAQRPVGRLLVTRNARPDRRIREVWPVKRPIFGSQVYIVVFEVWNNAYCRCVFVSLAHHGDFVPPLFISTEVQYVRSIGRRVAARRSVGIPFIDGITTRGRFITPKSGIEDKIRRKVDGLHSDCGLIQRVDTRILGSLVTHQIAVHHPDTRIALVENRTALAGCFVIGIERVDRIDGPIDIERTTRTGILPSLVRGRGSNRLIGRYLRTEYRTDTRIVDSTALHAAVAIDEAATYRERDITFRTAGTAVIGSVHAHSTSLVIVVAICIIAGHQVGGIPARNGNSVENDGLPRFRSRIPDRNKLGQRTDFILIGTSINDVVHTVGIDFAIRFTRKNGLVGKFPRLDDRVSVQVHTFASRQTSIAQRRNEPDTGYFMRTSIGILTIKFLPREPAVYRHAFGYGESRCAGILHGRSVARFPWSICTAGHEYFEKQVFVIHAIDQRLFFIAYMLDVTQGIMQLVHGIDKRRTSNLINRIVAR